MAILRNRISFNNSTWIIILSSLYIFSQVVESFEPNARENLKKLEASFDDDNLREFYRLLRQLRNNREDPLELMNSPSVRQRRVSRESENSMIIGEEIRLAEIKESPMTLSMDNKQWALPDKFSYVAREFYRSFWEKHDKSGKSNFAGVNNNKIDDDKSVEAEEDSSFDSEENSTEMDWTTLATTDLGQNRPKNIFRNIISAPTSNCPPGQRKDRRGRCRKTLW